MASIYTMERDPDLQKHISIIATELSRVIPPKTMAHFVIPDVNIRATRKQTRIEARILELASTIVYAKFASRMFSNFHEWEAFRHVATKAAARQLAPDLVTSMRPFGNCLTMACECFDELRAALGAEGPEYVGYVERVQLVTNNWKQHAESARDYHCIVIVRLPTHCIVLDAVACGTASAILLGELYQPPNSSSEGFVYVACGDSRLLVEYEPNALNYTLARLESRELFEYNDPYVDVKGGLSGAVQDLAFPSVNWHLQDRLPSRRRIFIHQTWDRKPRNSEVFFEALRGSNGFVVETAEMRMNFEKRKITVKYIPGFGWLKREENAALVERLRRNRHFTLPARGQDFAKFKILLSDQGPEDFDEETLQSLSLMDEMCWQLGMPEGEVLRIAHIMLEVWAEHDESISKYNGCRP